MATKGDPRKIEWLPLDTLKEDPRNPKGHEEDLIDSSIGRFGMVDNIVLDSRTGQIISGHGRAKVLSAMEKRGESPPEGVKVDKDGGWLVPVSTGWSSRTDTEAAAALIALNRTTELGGWVDDSLLALLEELGEEGLTGVGYEGHHIEDLRAYLDGMNEVMSFEEKEESGVGEGIEWMDVHKYVVVVLTEENKPRLYELLSDLDWVLDMRDSTKRERDAEDAQA